MELNTLQGIVQFAVVVIGSSLGQLEELLEELDDLFGVFGGSGHKVGRNLGLQGRLCQQGIKKQLCFLLLLGIALKLPELHLQFI